jgi:pyrimidine-nucleoside phosphorylase
MSKKLAEGIDALVLDVKTGSGAFMQKEEDAVRLAEVMVETGKRMGKRMVALITDMEQPLGKMAGHSVEITECIDVLNGKGPQDLRELSIELSAWMFTLAEKTKNLEDGRALADRLIANGQALEKLRKGIALQGGDARVIDDPSILPHAQHREVVRCESAGYVTGTNCEEFGTALAMLGGGREKKEDSIDHAVGLEFHKRIGDRVEKDEPLTTIFYNGDARLAEAKKMIVSSHQIGPQPPREKRPLVRRIVGA